MSDIGRDRPDRDRVERVVVTSPQTAMARRRQRATSQPITELRDATAVGDVLTASLMRAQLGLALRMLAVFAGGLAGLPALFALAPGLGRVRVVHVPLPWLLLGVLSFPLLVVLGIVYLRQAERNEAEFEDLVGQQ